MDPVEFLQRNLNDIKDMMNRRFDRIEDNLQTFATKEHVEKLEKAIANLQKEKVDKEDFAPYRSNLLKVVMFVITTVLGGIIYFVFNMPW